MQETGSGHQYCVSFRTLMLNTEVGIHFKENLKEVLNVSPSC